MLQAPHPTTPKYLQITYPATSPKKASSAVPGLPKLVFYRDGQYPPERNRLRDLVSEVWAGTNQLVGVVRVVMQIVDHAG